MPFNQYLKKHAFTAKLIENPPSPDLGLVVVIPAFNELSLIPTLEALSNCEAPKSAAEVILVFNASVERSENVRNLNISAAKAAMDWQSEQRNLPFQLFLIEQNHLVAKHAGVGLARKIGMDEAVRRFAQINRQEGVIICFDADSKCDANYLEAIEQHFINHPNIAASAIYFEHPLSGTEFTSDVYKGIALYELHLRFYKLGLALANLPFAFHSIGSSMAVRAEDYCRQGGMNKRKAGEDFYFLQKFIDLGRLNELNTTRVIPSPRPSERVPFGTGRAITEMMDGKRNITLSYAFETFSLLKSIFSNIETWYDSKPSPHPIFLAFVGEENFFIKLEEIRLNSTNSDRFVKRFFQWFNGFQCLKFVHYLRDKHFPLAELASEVPKLLNAMGHSYIFSNPVELLSVLRKIENP